MATLQFSKSDVQKLLAEKQVVVIGDSVQRSVYKDLVCLLKANQLLTQSELKSKGEKSFQGDTLLEGGVETKGTNYKEVRKFTLGKTTVMFYFVTRCYNYYTHTILEKLKLDPPDVVIMNSCLWDLCRYGKNSKQDFYENVSELLKALVGIPNDDRLFIWNATLPVAKVTATAPAEDIRKANLYVRDQLKQSGKGCIFLDLHQIFDQHLYRRENDGVHWDYFAHRKITCLLLGEISKSWNFELPSKPASSSEISALSPSRPSISPSSHHYPSVRSNFGSNKKLCPDGLYPERVGPRFNVPSLMSRPYLVPRYQQPRLRVPFHQVPRFQMPLLQLPRFQIPPFPSLCGNPALPFPRKRSFHEGHPLSTTFRPLLNAMFPPFSRKRKHVEDDDNVDQQSYYKYPRKFM